MRYDHNVYLDWPDDEPVWIKSLVSTLDGRTWRSGVLPLNVCISEIIDWIELASGEDAWAKSQNRSSLILDLEQAVTSLGTITRQYLEPASRHLIKALKDLGKAGKAVVSTPPGLRNSREWVDLLSGAISLRDLSNSDQAVRAVWTDLVNLMRSGDAPRLEFQHFVDLLHAQQQQRRLDSDSVLREIVRLLIQDPDDLLLEYPGEERRSPEERVRLAENTLLRQATTGEVVVWLGYRGIHLTDLAQSGRVTFMEAAWYIPNARPDAQDFSYKSELQQIVEKTSLDYPEQIDQEPAVELLARVDLGPTAVVGAKERAMEIVDSILDINTYRSGGGRPFRTASFVLQDKNLVYMSWGAAQYDLEENRLAQIMTGDALIKTSSSLHSAMETKTLPIYLKLALEAQIAADQPFSEGRTLRNVSGSEFRSQIPLEDRVVQHIAAEAKMPPDKLTSELVACWPAVHWKSEVRRAVGLALASTPENFKRCRELEDRLNATSATSPWLVFVAENQQEISDLCVVESHKSWVKRIFDSINDHDVYRDFIGEYSKEAEVLAQRRKRARNALVHGNPISYEALTSVAQFSSFISRYAMEMGLECFANQKDSRTSLDALLAHDNGFSQGISPADYWRRRSADATSGSNS